MCHLSWRAQQQRQSRQRQQLPPTLWSSPGSSVRSSVSRRHRQRRSTLAGEGLTIGGHADKTTGHPFSVVDL